MNSKQESTDIGAQPEPNGNGKAAGEEYRGEITSRPGAAISVEQISLTPEMRKGLSAASRGITPLQKGERNDEEN